MEDAFFPGKELPGLGAVRCGEDLVIHLAQGVGNQVADAVIVFYNQNAFGLAFELLRQDDFGVGFGPRLFSRDRQIDFEDRALTPAIRARFAGGRRLGIDVNPALVFLDDAVNDREP